MVGMTGTDYLAIARQVQERCAEATEATAAALHREIPATLEALGSAIFALEQFGTCSWGCKGAAHTIERFAARAVSYSLAMLRLLWFGHYDEAFSLARNLGELANLLLLFSASAKEYESWIAGDEISRRNDFGAGAVRKRLAEYGSPVALERDHFNELSARYSHPGQDPTPQMHNLMGVPTMGGRVQPEALRWGLLQEGIFVAIIASTIGELADLSDENGKKLADAANNLGDAASKLQPVTRLR
jgi:hypothetical protein